MYVCMYIPMLAEAVCQELQCLLDFHYDVGRQSLEVYPCIMFRHPQSLPLSVTCRYMYIIMLVTLNMKYGIELEFHPDSINPFTSLRMISSAYAVTQ